MEKRDFLFELVNIYLIDVNAMSICMETQNPQKYHSDLFKYSQKQNKQSDTSSTVYPSFFAQFIAAENKYATFKNKDDLDKALLKDRRSFRNTYIHWLESEFADKFDINKLNLTKEYKVTQKNLIAKYVPEDEARVLGYFKLLELMRAKEEGESA